MLSPLYAEPAALYSTETFVFPGETQGVTLHLKPRGEWRPFFWGLADIPAEFMDQESDAYTCANTLSPVSVCGVIDSLALDRNDPAIEECLAKIRSAVEYFFGSESSAKRNYPIYYSTLRTFADTASGSDLDDLKRLFERHDMNFFSRVEICRGLYRLMGEKEFGPYRQNLKEQSIDLRFSAALVWGQETNQLGSAERITLAEEAITHEKWWVRAKAIELLWKIPASESEVMPIIEKGLADGTPEVRMRALQVLFRLNPEKAWPVLQMHYILERQNTERKDTYSYFRSVEILAGAASDLEALYNALKPSTGFARCKIIAYLMADGAAPSLESISSQPNERQTPLTMGFSALGLWDAGRLEPLVGLYKFLDLNEERSIPPRFALFFARLRIGLLMDYFEKAWERFSSDPDKNAWSLLLYNEALAKAAQAPFVKDAGRAQSLIEKNLNSGDPWLQLLAARAAIIAHLDTKAREKNSKKFFFYHHDRKDGENFGDFVVGWLWLKPEFKKSAGGFEVHLNPSVNWRARGIFFGKDMLINNTQEIMGKNGQRLIRSVSLVNPSGKWIEPLEGDGRRWREKGVGEGWGLRVKCRYKDEEQWLSFPIKKEDL